MDQFRAPVHHALDICKHERSCPRLSDFQWLQMGVERSLKECRSGRGFFAGLGNCSLKKRPSGWALNLWDDCDLKFEVANAPVIRSFTS